MGEGIFKHMPVPSLSLSMLSTTKPPLPIQDFFFKKLGLHQAYFCAFSKELNKKRTQFFRKNSIFSRNSTKKRQKLNFSRFLAKTQVTNFVKTIHTYYIHGVARPMKATEIVLLKATIRKYYCPGLRIVKTQ